MTNKPLTKPNVYFTVCIKSGDEVRCRCGQKVAQAMISGETWYKCRTCKEEFRVVVV